MGHPGLSSGPRGRRSALAGAVVLHSGCLSWADCGRSHGSHPRLRDALSAAIVDFEKCLMWSGCGHCWLGSHLWKRKSGSF